MDYMLPERYPWRKPLTIEDRILYEYKDLIRQEQQTWLVTGCAGFIGSNLTEELLKLDQKVIGIDNFSNGFKENLVDIQRSVSEKHWQNFDFIEGDICHLDVCKYACNKSDYVLHMAALNAVPRSILNPINTNRSNVTGTLNLLVSAKDANIKRFVYAASSSTYGDSMELPKVEHRIGAPLSPYAVSKYVTELYANVFYHTYGLDTLGLRYFNVFGKRQNPFLTYSAVIPRWSGLLMDKKQPTIFGDGETTRDFCYIKNAVQANLKGAITKSIDLKNRVMNIAYGNQITLNDLLAILKDAFNANDVETIYAPFRQGDIKNAIADISLAKQLIDYKPQYDVRSGIEEYVEWFKKSRDWVPTHQPKPEV